MTILASNAAIGTADAGLIALLGYLDITVLHIAATALTAYIPLLVIVILLWYFVGRILSK